MQKKSSKNKLFFELGIYGMDSLESVTMGTGVIEIGNSAFGSCARLEKAYIGENVRIIRGLAFAGCGSLKSIFIPGDVIACEGFITDCETIHCGMREMPTKDIKTRIYIHTSTAHPSSANVNRSFCWYALCVWKIHVFFITVKNPNSEDSSHIREKKTKAKITRTARRANTL